MKDSYAGPRLEIKSFISKKKDKSEKREAKTDALKESTYDITWKMYKKKMSIEEIAEERNLAVGTIEGHMARFVKEDKLSIYKFISKEEYQAAKEFLEAGGTLKDAYDALEGNVSYGLLKMVQAAMENEKREAGNEK